MSRAKLLLPIFLAISGIAMLSGCIYIPTFGLSVHDTSNLKKKVGDAGSNKPIKLNVSTRAEVIALIGEPMDTTLDNLVAAYAWNRRWGVWFFPLCFWNDLGYFADDRTRYFRFTYDSDHILIRVELTDEHNYKQPGEKWQNLWQRQMIKQSQ
jgi:hypothetical protein